RVGARRDPPRIVFARCEAQRARSPFALAADVVRAAAGLADDAPEPERIADLFVEHLRAITESGALVLVVDDAQWADEATRRALAAAIGALSERPLLVLALARADIDERFPSLFAQRNATRARLEGLDAASAETIAREVLGAAATPETVARVIERAGGNALFLE